MRVQFTISEDEERKLKHDSQLEGYPDIHTYCKDYVLREKTFLDIWKKVERYIEALPVGEQFAISDIIQNSPAVLGKKVFENQESLGIRVKGKDKKNSNIFIKVADSQAKVKFAELKKERGKI